MTHPWKKTKTLSHHQMNSRTDSSRFLIQNLSNQVLCHTDIKESCLFLG